jgi:predicted membrane protein
VFAGFFLLLNNLGYVPHEIYDLVISWQALLIAIGVTLLFSRDRNSRHGHFLNGILLIFIGALFMVSKFVDLSLSGFIIPVILIFIGLLFIVRSATGRGRKERPDFDPQPFEETPVAHENVIKREYVFAGSKEKWTQGALQNVEIAAVFGGVELDLTQAELAEDMKGTARIKVSAVFGGVVLYVPEDWNIILQKTGVCGGFVDSRSARVIAEANPNKSVIFELEAVFGGGEIKCYE